MLVHPAWEPLLLPPRPLPSGGMIVEPLEINLSVIVVLSWSVALCRTMPVITILGASCIVKDQRVLPAQPPTGEQLGRLCWAFGGLSSLLLCFPVGKIGLDIKGEVQGP